MDGFIFDIAGQTQTVLLTPSETTAQVQESTILSVNPSHIRISSEDRIAALSNPLTRPECLLDHVSSPCAFLALHRGINKTALFVFGCWDKNHI